MAIEVTRNFDMALRWSVEVENMMIAVERLLAYGRLEPEKENVNEEVQQITGDSE